MLQNDIDKSVLERRVNMYLTELHAHTKETSPCSHITANELVHKYKELGYSTLVITDHYTEKLLTSENPVEVVERFLQGYNTALLTGEKIGLKVLLGMEIRFTNEKEDYLVYGVTKEFLIANYDICKKNIIDLRKKLDESTIPYFISQAHPGRSTCKYPTYLDGIEVFNAMNHQAEMNTIAENYSKEFNLIPTSGTDCHNSEIIGKGGISTLTPIITINDLIISLKRNNYKGIN